MLRFRSKVDAWLVAAMMISVIASIGGVAFAIADGATPWVVLVPVLTIGLMTWILAGTCYEIDASALHVRSGPLRRTVPLSSIRELRSTNTVWSAPALSLDRLEVRGDAVLAIISPRDRAGFIRAMRERIPDLRVDDRGPSRAHHLGWALALPPILILLVVTFVLFKPRAPLEVTVTERALEIGGGSRFSVPLAQISTVTLADELPPLFKVAGFNSATTLEGRFRSNPLGTGQVFVRRNQPPYVVARTNAGFVIFNMNDSASTRRVYDTLREHTDRIQTPSR